MKINISEVTLGNLHKELDYAPEFLDLEIKASDGSFVVLFEGPVKAVADLNLIDKELMVNVVLSYKLKMACSRCVKDFELAIEKKCIFVYNVRNLDAIDITDSIREEIILEYPVKPLCKESCRGICSACGADLNIEDCRCK